MCHLLLCPKYWAVLHYSVVKLAAAYAALALGLLTFTTLFVRTLYARMHELGSGDVKL